MIHASTQRPLQNLNKWKAEAQSKTQAKEKPAATPHVTYEQAMERFDKDISQLKSLDGVTPKEPMARCFKFPVRDTNPAPGEVEVSGVGKLLSTPDGGWEAEITRTAGGIGSFHSHTRSYSINSTGSITVLEESRSRDFYGSSNSSQLYTLDPNKETITDYSSSRVKEHGPVMQAILNPPESQEPPKSTLGQRLGQAFKSVLQNIPIPGPVPYGFLMTPSRPS